MISPLINLATEEKSGVAVLGIDPKAIVLQAGTFLILYLLVRKFALKKIVSTLEERRETINKGVDLGLEMEKKKAEFDDELKALHHKARQQADEILANANQESSEIIKAGEATAAEKIDQMLKDAEARIAREMDQARKDLKSEMLGLVAEATEVILDEKIDQKKDASLIARALEKVRA